MQQQDSDVINLHGEWRFERDPDDVGTPEEWFNRRLSQSGFQIPGTCAEHRLGERLILEPGLTKEAVQCLRTEYQYQGAVWYQTEFHLADIPPDRHIFLFLERVMGETQVWIDGVAVSRQDSLSTPHQCDLTRLVSAGKTHQLSIRIDNRDKQNIGNQPSARTDQTQTIWNGMTGKVELQIRERYHLNDLLLTMDSHSRQVTLTLAREPVIADWQHLALTVTISTLDGHTVQQESRRLEVTTEQPDITVAFSLAEAVGLWDEFTPQRYQLAVEIRNLEQGPASPVARVEKITGFRQLGTYGNVLKINGVQRFLRGNIDCCIYPLTGYPPTTEAAWSAVFRQLKAYGLNHVRFHSWCPPEAAFVCADREGLYLQIEGPVWMDDWMDLPVGKYPEHYRWLPEEAERIIRTWSIHPSFCIFSNGNELNGDFDLLRDIIRRLKAIQPQILYTLTSNWDRQATDEDDIFIAQSSAGNGLRGQYFLDRLAETTTLNFSTGVNAQTIPVISHEVGQYVVYPNVAEIPRYTGCLKPVNLERIRDDLRQKNLLPYLESFIHASGKLALYLYKMEIEAALRTPNMAGIQLLSLHDFPGQSTATVGLLDAFYASKGIISGDAFRHFCCETVPLLMMPTLFFSDKDDFIAEIQIAHYGAAPLNKMTLRIEIVDQQQHCLFTEDFSLDEIPVGLLAEPVSLRATPFRQLTGRHVLQVNTRLLDTPYQNQWDIWVYGKEEPCLPPSSIRIFRQWSSTVEDCLNNGEKVLLLPAPDQIRYPVASSWFPVFWSPVHFASKDPCGMIITNQHPLFSRYFCCESHATLEWKTLLESGFAMNMDALKSGTPLTLLTPNFFHHQKATHLFEAQVGNGRILVCSLNSNDLSRTMACESFRGALYRYMDSADFNPTETLSVSEIAGLFR